MSSLFGFSLSARYCFQSSRADQHRYETISSVYLIEVKDDIREFCAAPYPENSPAFPLAAKAQPC